MTKQYTDQVKAIADQRRWIEDCEANGVSYADGERGQRIREADEGALSMMLDKLELLVLSHRG